LKANETYKIFLDNIVDELVQEASLDARKVGQRPVLQLINTQSILAESEDVSMNIGGIDLLDVGNLSPAAEEILEVSPKHDGVLRDLEMAVDWLDSKNVMELSRKKSPQGS
jgi:hypothetical protein